MTERYAEIIAKQIVEIISNWSQQVHGIDMAITKYILENFFEFYFVS